MPHYSSLLNRKAAARPGTLLDRYAERLGVLMERSTAVTALQAARRDAELKERQARLAAEEATATGEALREEMQRRLETQSRLAHLATHDPLTGLPNRALLADRLESAISLAARSSRNLALLYLDLDHFKDVNDTLGHAAGDTLLRTVSQRLQSCLRGDAMVARMGGDEFALWVADMDASGASALAQRIIAALSEPITTAGHRVFVGVSIGITVYPQDATDPPELLSNGDIAMYRAKQEGRNCFQLFDRALNEKVRRRAYLEQALHEAVSLEQIAVEFQPQVDLATEHVVGFEALLRWTHPGHGPVLPTEFVPIAERSGLINNLGSWILHESCRQVVAWNAAGLPKARVAVNLATAQFRGSDVPSLVAQILEATRLPPEQLELEITETGVMQDMRNAADVLRALATLGVTIAIDDFGTGYSSLSYLRRLPVDKIKIDRSFVSDVEDSEDASAIARAIVGLAHTLRLRVVAEGIETEGQAEFFRNAGCDFAQGFLYGRPMPPQDGAALLSRRSARASDPTTTSSSAPLSKQSQP